MSGRTKWWVFFAGLVGGAGIFLVIAVIGAFDLFSGNVAKRDTPADAIIATAVTFVLAVLLAGGAAELEHRIPDGPP